MAQMNRVTLKADKNLKIEKSIILQCIKCFDVFILYSIKQKVYLSQIANSCY